MTDRGAALRQKIFDILFAQVEAMVTPNFLANNVGRESMSFVWVHQPSSSISSR
jgi:hypothetical protein